MHCPFCQASDTRVVDSRLRGAGFQIRRRRQCVQCGARFNTFETPEVKLPNVVKSDGTRESFDVEKLRAGVRRALEKRPVETEEVEEAINRILQALRSLDESEIPSRAIGEHVMAELSRLDQVAYVRFASVYRRFEDVQSFLELVEQLRRESPEALPSRQLSLLGDRFAGAGEADES